MRRVISCVLLALSCGDPSTMPDGATPDGGIDSSRDADFLPDGSLDTGPRTPVVDVVTLPLRAESSTSRVVMWGQGFRRGDVPATDALELVVRGSARAVQVNHATTWSDGTLRFAVLATPVMAETGELDVLLRRGGSGPAGRDLEVDDLPDAALAWSSPFM